MGPLYEVKPWLHRSSGVRYSIDATREFFVPSVACDVCGCVFDSGPEYPDVDLSGFGEGDRIRRPRRTTPEEYYDIAVRLQSWLGWRHLPPPGATFGVLVGSIEGTPPDFANAPLRERLLATGSCVNRLWAVEGLVLPALVPTRLRSVDDQDVDLREVHCERRGRIHPDAYATNPTPMCGRCRMGGQFRVDDLLLSADTLEHVPDLFRVLDRPTVIVGTDRLKSAVAELGLVGIRFGLTVPVK